MKKNIIPELRTPSFPLKLGAGLLCLLAAAFFAMARPAQAQSTQEGGDAALAQELTNPLADLMTIPIVAREMCAPCKNASSCRVNRGARPNARRL